MQPEGDRVTASARSRTRRIPVHREISVFFFDQLPAPPGGVGEERLSQALVIALGVCKPRQDVPPLVRRKPNHLRARQESHVELARKWPIEDPYQVSDGALVDIDATQQEASILLIDG